VSDEPRPYKVGDFVQITAEFHPHAGDFVELNRQGFSGVWHGVRETEDPRFGYSITLHERNFVLIETAEARQPRKDRELEWYRQQQKEREEYHRTHQTETMVVTKWFWTSAQEDRYLNRMAQDGWKMTDWSFPIGCIQLRKMTLTREVETETT
jgi:hypothetical protein